MNPAPLSKRFNFGCILHSAPSLSTPLPGKAANFVQNGEKIFAKSGRNVI